MKNNILLLLAVTSIRLFAAEGTWDATVLKQAQKLQAQTNRITTIEELQRLQQVISTLPELSQDMLYEQAIRHGHAIRYTDALRVKYFSEITNTELTQHVKILQLLLKDGGIEKPRPRFAKQVASLKQLSHPVVTLNAQELGSMQNVGVNLSPLGSPDNTAPFRQRRDALVPAAAAAPVVPTIRITDTDAQ